MNEKSKGIIQQTESISQLHDKCAFFGIDYNAHKNFATKFSITASELPTFLFFKNGSQVKNPSTISKDYYLIDRNVVDTKRCESLLLELTTEKILNIATPIEYHQLESDDLMKHIKVEEAYCLNESKDHKINEVLRRVKGSYISSASDEQLLIYLPFRIRLGLKYFSIGSVDDDSCPKKIKIFVNRHDMDFDSVDSITADHEMILTQKQCVGKERILLKNQLKFKSVNSLTVFVSSNFGSKQTKIGQICVFGVEMDKIL